MLIAYFDEFMGSIGGYEPWWSWNTVDIVLIWNCNEFAIVPKGSDLLYYTNGSHKVFVKVLCGWSVRRSRSYQYEKNKERQEFNLGDAQGTPSKYFKDTQASKLGDAPVGIPSFFFNNYRYTSVFVLFTWFVSFLFFIFPLRTMLVWDSPSLIYRMLHVLHLYLLSMIL